MTIPHLRATVNIDTTDGTAELRLEVEAAGFAGTGSAWFSTHKLEEFANELGAFPLKSDPPPTLEGGYWSQLQPTLEQRHVFLQVRPEGRRGYVRVRTELATPVRNEGGPEEQQSAKVSFLTDYASLGQFSRAFEQLTRGTVREALLGPGEA